MNSISQSYLYLSIQSALGGEITPNLRAISVEYGYEWICLYFYYDQEPSDYEKETAEIVASEVHVDFDYKIPTIKVWAEKIHTPYPEKIPEKGHWVFQRYEPIPISKKLLSSESIIGTKITEISQNNILISTGNALLSRITSNLRWVCGEYGMNFIFLFFYYDQKPSELEMSLAEGIEEKIVADFKDAGLKSCKIEKIHRPFPKLLVDSCTNLSDNFFCIYHRYEHIPEKDEIS